jgi:hypothetical protein
MWQIGGRVSVLSQGHHHLNLRLLEEAFGESIVGDMMLYQNFPEPFL